jgi:hypothetical protein
VRPQLAVFRFDGLGLWIRGEVLGATAYVERDGQTVLVSIPRARSERDGTLSDETGRDTGIRVGISSGDRVVAATVRWFDVVVFTESTASADDPPEADKTDAQRALSRAMEIAFGVADDLLLWFRAIGQQFWMPPSHVTPEVVGAPELLDADSGKRVRNVGDARALTAVGNSEDGALGAAGVDDAFGRLAEGGAVPEAALMLHDAHESLTARSGRAHGRRDTRRAVLLAAIASEVQIRATLRDKTPRVRADLVELFAKNWREIEAAIAVIPHTFMKAAVGRSLHEDDPQLFKDVGNLFKLRNGVAHKGDIPTLEDARKAVSTARALSNWLDGLPSPG